MLAAWDSRWRAAGSKPSLFNVHARFYSFGPQVCSAWLNRLASIHLALIKGLGCNQSVHSAKAVAALWGIAREERPVAQESTGASLRHLRSAAALHASSGNARPGCASPGLQGPGYSRCSTAGAQIQCPGWSENLTMGAYHGSLTLLHLDTCPHGFTCCLAQPCQCSPEPSPSGPDCIQASLLDCRHGA